MIEEIIKNNKLNKHLSKLDSLVEKHFADQKDGAHDLAHLRRVAQRALRLAASEEPSLSEDQILTILAAGLFHDIVSLPKDHPESHLSSKMAAELTERLLSDIDFPADLIPEVCHAIHAHSFSANIPAETLAAKCVQDADRVEALGALGVLRVFCVSGQLGRAIYDAEDPLAKSRKLNDKEFGLDHFERKLLKLPDTMQTESGRQLASDLAQKLKDFRNNVISELETLSIGASAIPAHRIADAAYQAGQDQILLFCSKDPFATERSLAPESFLLDRLIPIGEQCDYTRNFLEQLAMELEV